MSDQSPGRTSFESLPAPERARMYWDEYVRLLDEFEERTPRRGKIDACVLQYAHAVADVARTDQLAALAREFEAREVEPGGEWEEYRSANNVPDTCDFLLNSEGETTKDVTNRYRCGRPAGWRRGSVLACEVHVFRNLVVQKASVRDLVAQGALLTRLGK